MTEWQILTKVEIPLGLPLLIGGMRSATLQVIATVTLAAYVAELAASAGSCSGASRPRLPQMLAGSIVVIVLALAL